MLYLSEPVHYNLEIYPFCNNQCLGCGNIDFAIGKKILASTWRLILEKIQPHAAHVRISGGEPSLHPEFENIIRTLSDMNIPFILFTNGRWQNPDHIINLLCQTPQCRGLLVSLHSHIPEIHDAFTTVKGSFSETLTNIKKSIDSGLTIATSTIILPSNTDAIQEIISFHQKHGIYQTTFSRYVSVKNHNFEINSEQLKSVINIIELNRNNGYRAEYSVCIPQCFKLSSSIGCLSGITYCVIDPWGNLRPCSHVPINCGNLLEKSIKDIWCGTEMKSWREMIPLQCWDCVEISKCRGGCRAAAILNKKDSDPLMTQPLSKSDKTCSKTILNENMIPVKNFNIRKEPFGLVLINENRVVPVDFEAEPILDIIDGISTLREIKKCYGEDILNFIGHLYKEGIIYCHR
ncbi:Radical SAM domain-containing protein [Desulfonema limicola]|uniref:Radical SAM domain-containing protein n=1 Tax=Desulfonema limicola TaxID=45656 RepID=A0A975B464_9BACT|nr:radical SAM protein [Desulfonema limicola]QTA78470.1 Radical SAM domain-containing protein [Desulfonema limicola]